ncbi:MAG: hypothetical protein K0Q73_6845 [Paenibacillus sp.]|jgi:hypothetical protein|nr:hypothetical protein [Paenibacillus sp.]
MGDKQEIIIVSAPTKAGEAFIRQLLRNRVEVAGIANNVNERMKLVELGVSRISLIDTKDENTWAVPDYPVGKIFLFESSLNLSCRYIRVCRGWTSKKMYVITRSGKPRLVYKALGADTVIHITSNDIAPLMDCCLN